MTSLDPGNKDTNSANDGTLYVNEVSGRYIKLKEYVGKER